MARDLDHEVWGEPGDGVPESLSGILIPAVEEILSDEANAPIMVLDVGCGVGRLAIPIAHRYPACRVYGVDPDEEMLAEAQRRCSRLLLATSPPPGYMFDVAYSMLVFQHLPAAIVEGWIATVSGVLRPGGLFRFQWVPEGQEGPLSHPHPIGDVARWCEQAGLDLLSISVTRPQWAWATARRSE